MEKSVVVAYASVEDPISRDPLTERKVKCLASVPPLISVRVSCPRKEEDADDEATWSAQNGVEVPIPTFCAPFVKMESPSVDVAHLELEPVGHVLRQVSPVRQSSAAESAVVDAYGSRDAVVEVATM